MKIPIPFLKPSTKINQNQPTIILFGGIIIDSLLLLLFIHISGSKQRTINYAKSLNKDLELQALNHATLNKRFELALSASNVGVWEFDITTKNLIWDESMFQLYGLDKMSILRSYDDLSKAIYHEDRAQTIKTLHSAINDKKKFEITFRIELPNKNLRYIKALGDIILKDDAPNKIIGVNLDITDEKDKEQKLTTLANYDTLSQLKNRFNFNETCTLLINKAMQLKKQFALILIDIDDFKQVNDLYGHESGDKLIQLISETLRKSCSNRDSIYRLGGDEFAILTDFIEDDTVTNDIAERIILAFKKPFNIEKNDLISSCSIGIALFPEAGNNIDELMRNADIALYKSKAEGKNCTNFFTHSLNVKAKRLRFIKNNLIKAANNGEFYVAYQPILDIITNETFAVESLARWNSSQGSIQPSEFIANAEKNNQINFLGNVIIDKIFDDYRGKKSNLKISINCSSKQLTENSNFKASILKKLEKSSLDPKNIILELTETVLIKDYHAIRQTLDDIHYHGIDIAIDDFGTGYSSLSVLANIQFQYLKIDREFVKNIHEYSGLKILESICNVANSLNKIIIAEGVETKEQVEKLASLGINLIQGFYFSKPVDINKIPKSF